MPMHTGTQTDTRIHSNKRISIRETERDRDETEGGNTRKHRKLDRQMRIRAGGCLAGCLGKQTVFFPLSRKTGTHARPSLSSTAKRARQPSPAPNTKKAWLERQNVSVKTFAQRLRSKLIGIQTHNRFHKTLNPKPPITK